MPSNFHSDLPNDQLHNPKDFAVANNSSALVKSENGDLTWETPPYDLKTIIDCAPDVSGGLHNTAFFIEKDASNKYQVYFEVVGQTTTPTIVAGYTGAKVAIQANDTNIKVGNELAAELRRKSFTVVDQSTGKLEVTGMSSVNNTIDDNTDFNFENQRTFNTTTVLTSTNGALSWLPGGAGGGGAVSDVDKDAVGTSTGNPITVNPTQGNVKIKSNAYNGGNNVGHVPTGGTSSTFLKGDGTWAALPSGGTTYAGGGGINIDTNKTPNEIEVDSNVVVTITDAQVVSGNKNFLGKVEMQNSTEVTVPTLAGTDNSSRAASTSFIKGLNYGQGTVTSISTGDGLVTKTITGSGTIDVDSTVLRTTGAQTISGVKTFADRIVGKTEPRGSNNTNVATTEFVQNEIANVGGGTVQSVTATSPIKSTGGANPDISLQRATATAAGYLSQTDFNTFNSKQNRLTLTTTGTGSATLVGATLNIPAQANAVTGYEESFKGFINTTKGGSFMQSQQSTTPFLHTEDITAKTGLTSLHMIDGGFHIVQQKEKFDILSGIIEGLGTCQFELYSIEYDCQAGTAGTPTKVASSAALTLAGKPTCWEIRPAKAVTFNANTILALAITVGASDSLRGSYQAQYISTY